MHMMRIKTVHIATKFHNSNVCTAVVGDLIGVL